MGRFMYKKERYGDVYGGRKDGRGDMEMEEWSIVCTVHGYIIIIIIHKE
jgi:hypothetical protein